MSEWTGPTPSAQQYPASPTNGIGEIVGRIKDQGTKLREVTANLLRSAGIRLDPNGMTIDSSLNVTGAMAVGGTLSLPAGIIDNDALASPVVPTAFYQRVTGFAMPMGYEVKTQITLSPQPGFTKVVIIATASASVRDTIAVGDAEAWMSIVIGGVSGPVDDQIIAGGARQFQSTLTQLVTGLTTGSTIVIQNQVASGIAMAADASNEAVINGAALWFR